MASAPSSESALIMIVQAVLFAMMCLCSTGSNGQQQLVYMGSTVYLPTTNLQHNVIPLRGIFEGNLSSFLVEENYTRVLNTRRFQDSAERIFSELSTTFGLSGSPVKAVELSLENTFNAITLTERNVTSCLVVVESYSKRTFLRVEQPSRSVTKIPLRADFLADLRSLPTLNPSTAINDNAWGPFRSFLLKWGSHYISAIYYGTWLRQWSVAASRHRYSSRQIEAKACAKLTGVATIPSIEGCAGFSNQEMTQALSLETNDQIEVRGGLPATASAIALQRTEALTRTFIIEGHNSTVPVRYEFLPIWRPVLDTYTSTASREWKAATALEAYFNGFRAFNCPQQQLSSPRMIIQQLRLKTNGFFECVRTCVGCKSNYDCTLYLGACYCYGDSCIIAPPPDGHPVVQKYRDDKSTWDLPNLSCTYNFPYCVCNTRSKEPNCGTDGFIPIWSQERDQISTLQLSPPAIHYNALESSNVM